jgi:hypothetical protein
MAPCGDKRGVDLISDALPFGRLWYGEPNAVSNATSYAKFFSRLHDVRRRSHATRKAVPNYDTRGLRMRRNSLKMKSGVRFAGNANCLFFVKGCCITAYRLRTNAAIILISTKSCGTWHGY